MRVTVFHWQLSSWGSSIFGKATTILLLSNTILACTLKTRKQCEYYFKSILSVQEGTRRLPLESEFQSLNNIGLLTDQPSKEKQPRQIFSEPANSETVVRSSPNVTQCSKWIPKKYRSCISNEFKDVGIPVSDLYSSTLVSTQSGSRAIYYQRYPPASSSLYSREDGGFLSGEQFISVARPIVGGGMIEIPLLHLQTWKRILKVCL